jgi:hypothetical protein
MQHKNGLFNPNICTSLTRFPRPDVARCNILQPKTKKTALGCRDAGSERRDTVLRTSSRNVFVMNMLGFVCPIRHTADQQIQCTKMHKTAQLTAMHPYPLQ